MSKNFIVLTFILLPFLTSGQDTSELVRRNGFKDIKLGSLVDSVRGATFEKDFTELKEFEAKLYEVEVKHQRFAIGDFGLPAPELMESILDMLDAELQAGRKIYLHCWGGIGRTGTTVGCYLVRHGKTGEEALRQLAEWWRTVPKSHIHQHSPETREQAEFIRNWVKHENRP